MLIDILAKYTVLLYRIYNIEYRKDISFGVRSRHEIRRTCMKSLPIRIININRKA